MLARSSLVDGGGAGGSPVFLGEDLVAYLVLALGGAMFVGNLLAVLRPPPPTTGPGGADAEPGEAPKVAVGRSLVMAAVGLLGAVWGLASLLQGS